MNARRAKARSRIEREELRATLTEASASPPRYLRTLRGSEVWVCGRVLFTLPVLCDDYPDDLKAAVDRRRRASLSGACDCGGRWDVTRRGRVEMWHETGCDATEQALDALAAGHGMAFARVT